MLETSALLSPAATRRLGVSAMWVDQHEQLGNLMAANGNSLSAAALEMKQPFSRTAAIAYFSRLLPAEDIRISPYVATLDAAIGKEPVPEHIAALENGAQPRRGELAPEVSALLKQAATGAEKDDLVVFRAAHLDFAAAAGADRLADVEWGKICARHAPVLERAALALASQGEDIAAARAVRGLSAVVDTAVKIERERTSRQADAPRADLAGQER